MLAAGKGQLDVVEQLVRMGADAHAKDKARARPPPSPTPPFTHALSWAQPTRSIAPPLHPPVRPFPLSTHRARPASIVSRHLLLRAPGAMASDRLRNACLPAERKDGV